MGELRATAVTEVHVIVPEGIDDPARPSGGNTYDRRVCRGLAALGWTVHEHEVTGAAELARAVARLPDGAVVLLDGLIASPAPEALVPEARPAAAGRAHAHAARRPPRARRSWQRPPPSSTTSAWTRRRLAELYALRADRIHVAEPGVDAAGLAPGTAAGDALLCVAAVTPGKGHDVLLDGLATVDGSSLALHVRRQPGQGPRVRRAACAAARTTGCASPGRAPARSSTARTPPRTCSCSPRTPRPTAWSSPRRWPAACRCSPTDVGGVTEALGHPRPGLLVPPGDPAALGAALRRWLEDAELRARLRRAARERRATLRPWADTASAVAGVLAGVARVTTAAPSRQLQRAAAPRRRLRRVPTASPRERRDERDGGPGQPGSGSTCASPRTRRARSAELAERLARHLPATGPLVIHDLGGGSGSMGRWLAPRLPGPQHWVVHDRDPDLLELAVAAPPPAATVEARPVRRHAAGAGRSRRRERRRRLGAARPADRGRADPDARAPAPGVRCCSR